MTAPGVVGVLRVDKPPGPTSHDIVARARRALGTRRIGHTGTLDPFASGLLLICVGPATRLAEYLAGLDKRYVATAVLGQATDTDDREGDVLRVSEAWRDLSRTSIEEALSAFVGEIRQVPPMYSAKKIEGERMYRKARRGETVHLEPVPVQVFEASVIEVELPAVRFAVHCSSGTYIRALARDLGEALGTGAHLSELRRTRIGAFDVSDSVSADDLHDSTETDRAWLTPAEALVHLPSVGVGDEDAARVAHGQAISAEGTRIPDGQPVAVLHDRALICVASRVGGQLRPRKVLVHD
jgi:tRNA pseudouridine55 synthase